MKPYVVQHFLEISAKNFPAKEVLRHKNNSITYQDLLNQSRALGVGLQNKGVNKGERIAILLDKSIEQVIAIFGVFFADAVMVMINPILHEKQIQHILKDSDVKLVISSQKFKEVLAGYEIIDEQVLNQLIAKYAGEYPQTAAISDDMATIIYTSGSTGMPKGIVITHRNLMDGARIVSTYLNITEDERILGLLPFNFDYGLNQLISTVYKGCTLVLFQYFMPNSLLKILHDEQITGLAAIPPIWASVFNNKLADLKHNFDFSKLRYITNSGGKIPVPTVKKIREFFSKTDLYLMYGLTEAFRSTYLAPSEVDQRPDSMGKAIPNVQIEVVNEQGQVCQPKEIGELIHRGACIARGYWNNPQKTAEVYKPNPLLPKENQFLETVVYSGDLVYKDESGFLYFVGRKDNMIKTAGYRVSPTEVEELLIKSGGVKDCVVFGLPDDTLGYKIRAVVVLNQQKTIEEVLNFCKAEAPLYLVPQEIYAEEKFPLTASGKLDRPKIQKDSIEKHGN